MNRNIFCPTDGILNYRNYNGYLSGGNLCCMEVHLKMVVHCLLKVPLREKVGTGE